MYPRRSLLPILIAIVHTSSTLSMRRVSSAIPERDRNEKKKREEGSEENIRGEERRRRRRRRRGKLSYVK